MSLSHKLTNMSWGGPRPAGKSGVTPEEHSTSAADVGILPLLFKPSLNHKTCRGSIQSSETPVVVLAAPCVSTVVCRVSNTVSFPFC